MADQHPGQVQTHGSRTAELVAVSRARHLLRHKPPYIFHDPFAFQFLSKRWKRILGSWLRDAFVSRILLRRLMPITTQPLTRARFTEDCLLAAIEDEFSLYSAVTFRGETYYRGLEIREYRRQPHDAAPRLRFGEDIFLLAWRLNNDRIIAPCDSISVDTWWSVAQPLDKLYSSTLVIAAADGQGVINSDAVPGGIYPTPLWQPGQLYFDERELKLPCGLPAGDYPLLLGMYATPGAEGESPQNLLIHSADGAPSDRQLEYLTTLVVPP